jgi:hypothetical protein
VKSDCTCFPYFKGSRNTGLKLSCRLSTVAPFEFVLTGSKYERLLRAKAPFLDSLANSISQFGGRVSKIA